MKEKLTVAIPVYNGYPYIKICINSLLSQTLKNFKILVVNDGSTDETKNYLENLEQEYSNIKVIHQNNKGVGATRNVILSLIDTEYYANMDADDVCMPGRLEKQLKFLEEDKDVGACGCIVEYFFDNPSNSGFAPLLPTKHNDIVKHLVTIQHGMVFPTLMFRTKIAKQTGGFTTDGVGEDWDFMLKLAKISKLSNVNEKLYKMRVHKESLSWQNWGECVMRNKFAAYSFLHPDSNIPFTQFKNLLTSNLLKKIILKIRLYSNIKFISFYRQGIIYSLTGKKPLSFLFFICAVFFAPHKAFIRIKKILNR